MRGDFVTAPHCLSHQLQLVRVVQAIGYNEKRGSDTIALEEIQYVKKPGLKYRIVRVRIVPAIGPINFPYAIQINVDDCRGTILLDKRMLETVS
jgi:hypothetical protein